MADRDTGTDGGKPRPAEPEAGRRGRRWTRAVLAVSLAANLLVAGMFLGERLKLFETPPETPKPDTRLLRDLGLGPFLSSLPPEAKRRMARRIRDQVGTLRDERQALVREVIRMLALMRAEPFEPAALARVIEGQKQRLVRRTELGRELMLEAIVEMTPQERLRFADRMERVLREATGMTGPLPGSAPRPGGAQGGAGTAGSGGN